MCSRDGVCVIAEPSRAEPTWLSRAEQSIVCPVFACVHSLTRETLLFFRSDSPGDPPGVPCALLCSAVMCLAIVLCFAVLCCTVCVLRCCLCYCVHSFQRGTLSPFRSDPPGDTPRLPCAVLCCAVLCSAVLLCFAVLCGLRVFTCALLWVSSLGAFCSALFSCVRLCCCAVLCFFVLCCTFCLL